MTKSSRAPRHLSAAVGWVLYEAGVPDSHIQHDRSSRPRLQRHPLPIRSAIPRTPHRYMKTGHIPKEASTNDPFEDGKARAGAMLLAAEGKMSLPELKRLKMENPGQICLQAGGGWKTK
jgi:hypothetical protein